jgi:hypothetical protein
MTSVTHPFLKHSERKRLRELSRELFQGASFVVRESVDMECPKRSAMWSEYDALLSKKQRMRFLISNLISVNYPDSNVIEN